MSEVTLSIYPDSITKLKEVAHQVVMPEKEKAEYVKEEMNFCRAEFSVYGAALTSDERFTAKKALFAKRVQFAKHKGFAPKSAHSRIWVKQQPSNENELA